MTRRQLFATVTLVLIVASAALGQTIERARSFAGTYTCLACNFKSTNGAHSQCEVYGHTFGLKLNNGTCIHFLANDHSVDLVRGGGRTNFPMTVWGVYDRNAHTIDVQKYAIDGIETAWSPEHHKMEMVLTHKQLLSKEERGGHSEQLTQK